MLKIAGLFSGPFCGRLSDIFGRKNVLILLICIESVSVYMLTIVPNNVLIIPCLIFGFSSFGLWAVADAFLTDITPRKYMSTVFGLYFTLSFFNQAIIPTVLGAIVDYFNSFNIGFIILSVIMPFSIPLIFKVKDKR